MMLSRRTFNLNDQINFANFSGDFNPIHIDNLQARRTISGQCVVHGIHALMWALESLLFKLNTVPSEINVKFSKPIYLDEMVICTYVESKEQLLIKNDKVTLADISLKFNKKIDSSIFKLNRNAVLSTPKNRDFSDFQDIALQNYFYRGRIELATSLFPNIVKSYSKESCCEIASISEIVGMQIPGLYSLLLSANIKFIRNNYVSSFYVENIDERFNLLKIAINASSMNCKIDAFLRQKPTESPSILELKRHITDSEFRSIKALIIGGSRGLGESVAKLIAVGGGESVITYSTGYEDCLKVANEITEFGSNCKITKLNFPNDLKLLKNLDKFNQIYYFPTPKIFSKRSLDYDNKIYENFFKIYVSSFEKLVYKINKTNNKIIIFYPSTQAIDVPIPELIEYIDSKIAGEALCTKLNKLENIKIITKRIPRTKTDQTMSLIKSKSESPENVMLPIIREMTYHKLESN